MSRYTPSQLIEMRNSCRSACNTINSKTAQNALIEAADMFHALAAELETARAHVCEMNVAMDGVCMRCGTRVFEPERGEQPSAPAQAADLPGDMDDALSPAIRAAQRVPGYWRSYGERALPLVSNRHSKASLCHLVNYLLLENDQLAGAAGEAASPGKPG